MKNIFLFLIIFTLSCSLKNNEDIINTPLVAYVKVDKIKTTVGDTINATFTIDKDINIKEHIPDLKKHFQDFIVYEEFKSKEKYINNRVILEFKYKLQVPVKGTYIIDPIEIKYEVPEELEKIFGKSSKVKTSKIYIEVKSNLTKEDKEKDIEDIKPLIDIPYISKNILIVVTLCFFISFIIIFYLFKILNKKDIKVPYYKIALKELKNIDFSDTKKCYFKLSNILRRFIDEEFNLKTLEKTTEEIEITLKKSKIKNNIEIISILKKIDIYKFTDKQSNKEEVLLFINKIIDFITINKDKEEIKK
ncbi:MAG: hypothetical protein KatS3mg068_1110 [Candidatus Sericytochromatia bacterium]|nr:MAG: hypothetical protein KatS3mg068_1110 [Candidatus Sericytochromatia bacterium]